MLDLNIPQVFDFLLERMTWLLGEHPIDYIKWDMNRVLVQPGHNGKAAANAQTHQYYRLLDTLVARFPHVEFEACSSGGGRIDYEVLKRSHRFWASDCNDALERNTIQRGMSYFFPPEVMGHILAVPTAILRLVSTALHFEVDGAVWPHGVRAGSGEGG